MAVLVLFTGPVNKEQYELLRKEVDWEGQNPDGAVLHVASFDATGAYVADVWESEEKFNTFVQSRLMPAFQKHNLPAPTVHVRPAHTVHLFETAEAYRV